MMYNETHNEEENTQEEENLIVEESDVQAESDQFYMNLKITIHLIYFQFFLI